MASVPIKPAYGPTLGRILSPWWRASSRAVQALTLAVLLGALALALGVFLTLENAHYSHAGKVSFSFAYRGLYKVAPEAGGYVRLERHDSAGRLEDSLAIGPLKLPAYSGAPTGELPLYAAGYVPKLRARYDQFVLRGEGKTRVDTVPAYEVIFTALVGGQTMWARNILLLPERAHAREGINIMLLTTPTANPDVTSPLEVASEGVLLRPLKTMSIS